MTSGVDDYGQAVTTQADGKVVVAGNVTAGFLRAQALVDPTRTERRGRRDLSERSLRVMGLDDGPDPLPLGFF